jgi:pimeloyl-ACP methyl ester carboxylesterase
MLIGQYGGGLSGRTLMATYVLVHGAWHGGWCWRRVAGRLRSAGHQVLTPTLTGLGERAHLGGPGVGLRTHVDDILGVLRFEDLRDVILVGHSYGGFVVREAADRMADRVRRIVLLDGWGGLDGESMDSRSPDWFLEWVNSVTADGAIAVPPASLVGVTDEADAAWVERLMTPQPRLTFSEPTRLSGAVADIPGLAVVCTPSAGIPYAEWAAEFGWGHTVIESGHDAMITVPAEVANVLLAQDHARG